MIRDPIVEEIHKIRREHAEEFDYDVASICEDYRSRETESKLQVVSRPPKRPLEQTGS